MITSAQTSRADGNIREYSIRCSGALMISDANEIKNALVECLDQADAISISLKEVERIDTACTQLLLAFSKSVEMQSKTLQWNDIPESVLNAFETLGVSDTFKNN